MCEVHLEVKKCSWVSPVTKYNAKADNSHNLIVQSNYCLSYVATLSSHLCTSILTAHLSKDVFLCTSICITSCHVYVGVCVRVQACQFPLMLIKGELRRSLAIRGMVIDVESSVGYKV